MTETDQESPSAATLDIHGDETTTGEENGLPDDGFADEGPTLMNFRPAQPGTPEALKIELAAAENRALRAYADLDNYKKRFQRELDRQRDIERERFLNVILSVADNLRRALNVADAESSPYRDGLLSVMRQIDNTLKDFGVEEIPAEKGMIMDPNVHDAITALTIPGAPHESIIEVVEPGYKMGDRILRPAKVVVAKSENDD